MKKIHSQMKAGIPKNNEHKPGTIEANIHKWAELQKNISSRPKDFILN